MARRSRFFRYDESSGTVVEVDRNVAAHRPRYPLYCEALAVDPSQIGEARDWDRQNGVPTDYRGDGSPIIQDAGHYRRYKKLHGVHDRRGFFR